MIVSAIWGPKINRYTDMLKIYFKLMMEKGKVVRDSKVFVNQIASLAVWKLWELRAPE